MKYRVLLTTTILLLLTSGALAADYRIDPGHSTILFSAKRMGVVNVYGRFNEFSGSLSVDDANPANSSIELEIKSASVDSNSERRDNHLRSPDFFNATQFPTVTFKSTEVARIGDDRYRVTGDLTLHGVTESVTAEVVKTGTGERRGSALIGFETVFRINRSDFGMNFMTEALSDSVQITFSLHGVARQD